jgi:hypothetical protein
MKTKNIFRMLLVAVALLLGANNVKAEEIVFYEDASGIGGSNPSYDIKDSRFADVQSGNVLHIEYDIQALDWGPTYKLYLFGCYGTTKIYEAVVTEGGSADIVLTSEDIASFFDRSNNYDPGRYAVVAGEWILIKKVSLIINGSVKQDTSMSFDQESVTLKFGETFIAPTLTTTPESLTVTWSSSNERCAMVSNGEVTIVGAGTAKITASFAGDENYKKSSASYTITVNKGTPVLSFGESEYTATVGLDFTAPTLNNPSNVNVYYFTNYSDPAEVNRETGAITLKNEGETEIIAKFDGDNNWEQAEAKYKLIVTKRTPVLSFPEESYTATLGEEFTPPTLNNPSNVNVYYYTNYSDPAEVNRETGAITLKSEGETEIIAKFDGDNIWKSAETKYKLIVTKRTPVLSFPEESYTATLGEEFTPPTLNNPSNVDVYYYTNNSNPADVNRETGAITLKNEGETEIFAKFDGDNIWKPAETSYKLIVRSGEQSQEQDLTLSFNPSSVELTLGDTFTAPTLSIKDAQNNDVIGLTITYSSNNEGLATVAADGTVTLIQNATGTATITASFAGNDKYKAASAQYTITVNNPVVPSFTITISPTTNGSVTADAESAAEGTLVTLTISPSSGYELDAISVKDAYNTDVQVNMTDYTFRMPASNVTVTATFKQTGSGPVGPTIPEDIENEHSLWTGSVSATSGDGHLTETLPASLFADIKRGDTFRVYVSDINNNENWKLYITNDANGWGALAFDDFSGGDLRRDTEGSSSYYHAEDGYGYFEFTCSEETATTLKANGTQMSFTWMTVIKVSYISNNSPEPTKYAITVSPTTNGTVTASAQSAAEGTTVTLTISPASGYEVDAISVKDANNANVTVNMSNYTFTMPASAVTVTVTFKQTTTTPSEYTITLSYDSSQGNVTVDSGTGKAGDTKWIYVTPSSNYVVSSVTTNPYISVIHYGDYQGSDAYYFTMPESNVTVYVSFQLKHRTASIGSSGYATFSCDEALNFAGITSLRAYIAKSIDANWVVLEQVTGTVAANTGLVIVGTTTDIPVANSGTSYSNNLLVPGNGSSVGGTGIYVLTNESGSVKFADTSAYSATVPVGKAYLQAPGTSAARLNIRWEGDATGIKVLKSDFNSDDTIFDLNGQRVITPSKGLYIINGKKVVIK